MNLVLYDLVMKALEAVQVDVITYYATENVMEHRQQIAVNKNYICYALKQGHMRIICKNSSARTLAKGHHAGPVTDARYSLNYMQHSVPAIAGVP